MRSTKTLRRGVRVLAITVGLAIAAGAAASPASADTTTKDATQHGTGALVPTERVAARPIVRAPGIRAAAAPASANLVTYAPPAGYQGNIGSCVAWTVDYGMLSWYANRDHKGGAPFAPMYTYSQIKEPGPEGGSYPYKAFNVAIQQGNDTKAHYWQGDFDDQTQPDASEVANARNYRIKGYSTLWSTNAGQGATGVESLKYQLGVVGRPVAIGTYLHSSFNSSVVTKTSPYYTGAGSMLDGAHEMMAIGYTDWGLYVQNSWGQGFGENGRFMMSWDIVGREVFSAHVIDGGFLDGGTNTTTDTVAPTNGVITRYATPGKQVGTTVPTTINYSASDASGIKAYNVWFQTNGGTWVDVSSRLSSPTSTSITASLTRGVTYNFAFRAQDTQGNWSEFKTANVTPKVYDNASYTTLSTGWKTVAWASAFNGSQVTSGNAGAWAKYSYTGRSFSLVATKASNRGQAYIYVDGVYKKTIDLYSATTMARTVVYSLYSTSSTQHTVTVKVAGTSGRPYVDLDAWTIF